MSSNNSNGNGPDINKIIHLYMPNATHPRFPNSTLVNKRLSTNTLNIQFMQVPYTHTDNNGYQQYIHNNKKYRTVQHDHKTNQQQSQQ